MVVKWRKRAIAVLRGAYDYIAEDSFSNAEKVRDEIIEITYNLFKHPEKYAPDKYKNVNNGNCRAFEKYRYRISYYVKQDEIIIVRVRHTSRMPVVY